MTVFLLLFQDGRHYLAPIVYYCYYLEPDRCLGTCMVRRSEANGALDDSASVPVSMVSIIWHQ